MPQKKTLKKARKLLRSGKSPSTAAGEFIREEIDRYKRGDRGAKSRKQAIAIGLSKARRAGVPLQPQPTTPGQKRTQNAMARAYDAGESARAARTKKRKKKVVARKRKKAVTAKAKVHKLRTKRPAKKKAAAKVLKAA